MCFKLTILLTFLYTSQLHLFKLRAIPETSIRGGEKPKSQGAIFKTADKQEEFICQEQIYLKGPSNILNKETKIILLLYHSILVMKPN